MLNILKKAALVSVLAASFLSSANAQKTELTMYYPVSVGGPLTKIVDSMVEEFEKKNPDIDVNAIYAGNYNDARIKSLAALKAGKPAQLAVMFSIDTYDLIEQNAIVSFSDILKSEEDKKWLNSFYPALMENGTTLGKVWAIPFQRSTIVMYYNKDAFKKAGLDPEKPPKNWDEMVSMGKKLTNDEQWGVMIPSTGYPYWMFGALAKQNGEVLMNGDGTKTYFDNPKVVDALQYWKDLSHKYNVMPQGTIEWGTLRKNFLSGKTAMMWHSTGNLTAVKKNATFDFGVAMLPANEMRGTPTGGGNFYIFKKTTPKQREASIKLIKFMTSPENSAKWSIGTGYIGISQASYDTPALKKYVEEFPPAKVARDQLKYATAELSTYQTGRVRKILDDTIQAVLLIKKVQKKL
ncbi:ABC transporter substrate-binding protein [Halarcobacter sp.]|uniref:ABC transporter substrate-binding protein n=1 Tax=Halarcobacter sp. TaxID=2321133 RepID=UPI002AABD108|nr:ABC transporter substrate-binding protein [Halarcobacter sp.]